MGVKKKTQERDDGLFCSLFLTFGPKLRAMLLRQGADAATAEDIVQDTMMTVWSKGHLYAEHKGAIATWIYAIARNRRIDRLRRQVVWDRLRDDLTRFYCNQGNADLMLQREEERREIGDALGELPPEQMEVVRLSFIEGLSQVEISQTLDLPLGTVKSRMRLAVEKLRCSSAEDHG